MTIELLERRIVRVESVLILLTIGAIATADFFVGRRVSLGPLYLIPLSYSVLTHRGRTTVALVFVCVALRQAFGPIEESSSPWFFFLRDLLIASVFAATVSYLRRLGLQRKELFETARRQRDDLAREIQKAAQVQLRLLTLNHPKVPGLELVARVTPLKAVGGDYYDFISLAGGRFAIVVADVAGKGLPAALLMPALRIALRAIVARRADPTSIIVELNEILVETTEPSSYATLFFALVDPASGEIDYVNAGHLPGLLISPDAEPEWLRCGGPPVGLLPDVRYDSGRSTLAPGSTLVLYTDGVTESLNERGEEMGLERLAAVAGQSRGGGAQEVAAAIEGELRRFLGGRELTDDATLIAIRRTPGLERRS